MAPIFSTFVALAAILSQVTAAPMMYPREDSAIGNEVAVSASGGVVRSDLKELASQTAYNGGNQYNYAATTTSTTEMAKETKMMKEDTTTEKMKEDTTEMMKETSTTEMMDETSTTEAAKETAYTTTAAAEYAMPTYGSGSSYWGGKGYNDCVQQCLAKFGQPAATYTANPVQETATPTENAGTGTTHTVIVAPTQGVLRYVPFAVNASIGDTVRFVWGAGPHTVTKSSALNPCNKSLDASFFTSGPQNKSFVFDQVVNDTNPTFFYCTVPNHCQKGMFGIINPPNAEPASVNSTVTVGSYMKSMVQTDSSMAALWSYVSNQTAGTSAENWGLNMDISSMPESQYSALAQNAMYTQLFYAANPGLVESGAGAADNGSGIVIPADITSTLQNLAAADPATSTYESVPAASTATSANANAAEASPAGSSYGNGSGRLASSTVLVGAIAVLASFVML
ncbi:hypothetical protein M407DRAFT_130736 [Tulasnella calospora MUT 4182]|uniref:Phytocyanin domain-containing protein n=1 Tax=Tulasnella calospora MUT 4182 TaxID=1051891 RepID=A0A0C3PZR1_9AGAM|nr:hypothetical protein M407DRAFT_130736 [Tulasnella calospora MUT 4182]